MNELRKNQAFLLLANRNAEVVTSAYHSIRDATRHIGDAFILYHQQEKQLPGEIEKVDHFAFSDLTLSQLNYIPIGFSVVPGNILL